MLSACALPMAETKTSNWMKSPVGHSSSQFPRPVISDRLLHMPGYRRGRADRPQGSRSKLCTWSRTRELSIPAVAKDTCWVKSDRARLLTDSPTVRASHGYSPSGDAHEVCIRSHGLPGARRLCGIGGGGRRWRDRLSHSRPSGRCYRSRGRCGWRCCRVKSSLIF